MSKVACLRFAKEKRRGGRGEGHGSELYSQTAWCGVCLHCPREGGEVGMNRQGMKREHGSVSSESFSKCRCRMVIVLAKKESRVLRNVDFGRVYMDINCSEFRSTYRKIGTKPSSVIVS